jgi:hypothetical protein
MRLKFTRVAFVIALIKKNALYAGQNLVSKGPINVEERLTTEGYARHWTDHSHVVDCLTSNLRITTRPTPVANTAVASSVQQPVQSTSPRRVSIPVLVRNGKPYSSHH